MVNVNTKIVGKTLTITVNLDEDHGPSASGKTTMIASTQGNMKLPAPFAEVQVGLNVYKKIS